MLRTCKKCGDIKDITFFVNKKRSNGNYYLYTCLDCNKVYNKNYHKQYREKNKEKLTKYQQERYSNNIDKFINYSKNYNANHKNKKKQYDVIYRQQNKEKIDNRIRKYRKKRRQYDICYRLRHSVSGSISSYLKLNGGSKNKNSCLQFLPFSIQELKQHLEKQFEPWMNWENRGIYHIKTWNDNDSSTWKWQIDHIVPHSKLPYKSMDEENFQKCWALDNLRPYSAKQNLLDSNRR